MSSSASRRIDYIGRSRFVSRYAYHHGFFDGYEREFRGFGMVEQWDTEEHRDGHGVPRRRRRELGPARRGRRRCYTRSWFHTGAFLQARSVSRQYAHEYWIEPALRPEARAADRGAMELPDSVITSDTPMSAFELQEAYRALKGLALRVEVYSDDGSPLAANPYSIAETNFTVERRQRIGPNKHAVFFAHPRETMTFHYERRPDDPRVTHDVTLETDAFGNIKRAVSIGYPRRAGYAEPEPALPAQFRGMLAYDQTRLHIVATEHRYTNDLADPAMAPDAASHADAVADDDRGVDGSRADAEGHGDHRSVLVRRAAMRRWGGVSDLAFENIPRSDVDGSGQVAAAPTRRMVSQARTLYRKDDLTGLCGPDQLESLALPGDTFTLALTPGARRSRFRDACPRRDAARRRRLRPLPAAGRASARGRHQLVDPGGARLLLARRHRYAGAGARRSARALLSAAPGGRRRSAGSAASRTIVRPARRIDRRCRRQHADGDQRLSASSQPAQVTDANGNRSAVAFDALGLVVGTAVMGKTSESLGDSLAGFVADLDDATVQAQLADPLANPGAVLGSATTRLIYDLFAYDRTRNDPQPSPRRGVHARARDARLRISPAARHALPARACPIRTGSAARSSRRCSPSQVRSSPSGPAVTPRWIAHRAGPSSTTRASRSARTSRSSRPRRSSSSPTPSA